MSVHIREIVENFPNLVSLVRGDHAHIITDLQEPKSASQQSLIFVGDRHHLQEALESKAQAWVVHKDLVEQVPKSIPHVFVSPNVALTMALVGRRLFPQTIHRQPIKGPAVHPSSHVAMTARLGKDCIVGPGAVVGENCILGNQTVIGANAVLEPGVKVGDRTHIYPLVYIGHGCEVGADCEIHPHTTIGTEGFGYAMDDKFTQHRITHFGRVMIEDSVHIGANVQIDRGTFLDSRIGSGTKIDNHCHFGHNIVIGKNTVITGGMIVAGSVTIGSYCVFGGRTTIAGHLSIPDKTKISGMSGVTKGISKSGDYGGFPLTDLRRALKARAAQRHLPAMLKSLKKIMTKLGMDPGELKDSGAE
jgi:UDP-3-O-[3-hydroxymyristoyl] glucosamine N-acyltransferase